MSCDTNIGTPHIKLIERARRRRDSRRCDHTDYGVVPLMVSALMDAED
jgi:hypothetical protein